MADLIEIQNMIEQLREKLHQVSEGKALTDAEVIRASQMLDVLLIEYQRMLNEKLNQ
ncbi:aspartyl-phosphate phosphatase Spo0E family protein [Sporomusa acidovorans]|uniref:Spo0E like sporulation regulatory protein n=1 Tax=Sporomusa acidovorans (strain ATCC 49682 / DSM 3132 / Mol) TaxID=1123286 RepID=A0ABZ3JBP1_SPOA4|nr:aspartyl-phosphate phosphatase Spo0E family protein [Sporomusa acidovorans]OZC13271.1 Spo0E like sporulation regulatory protein [Sporomusa acidovorans DSM 3132]SDD98578.1 Spo0E like sporulation regulatory protein [Sporomusa acidovorans]